jgi:hypothetical protein
MNKAKGHPNIVEIFEVFETLEFLYIGKNLFLNILIPTIASQSC